MMAARGFTLLLSTLDAHSHTPRDGVVPPYKTGCPEMLFPCPWEIRSDKKKRGRGGGGGGNSAGIGFHCK